MTTPENTKPFDLSLAQQGHPLVTRDGRAAKFMGYESSGTCYNKVAAMIEGTIGGFSDDGCHYTEPQACDLFLAPVGYCEGLPVFVGDKLIAGGAEITIENASYPWHSMKWPSKNVVVKTRMGIEQLYKVIQPQDQISIIGIVDLANKTIERAISDGDVIPTSVVEKLVSKAVNLWATSSDSNLLNVKEQFDLVLRVYKEDLTK